MECYVYILFSAKLGLLYKGHTSDVDDRLARHNAGAEHFTRKGSPWRLLWYTRKANRSEAYKLEMKLKNLSRVRLKSLMMKFETLVVDHDELDKLLP